MHTRNPQPLTLPLTLHTVNESKALHVAPVGRLAEVHPFLLEPLASLVHVGDRDPDMPEPSRVLVAGVVLDIGIVFGAPVVG